MAEAQILFLLPFITNTFASYACCHLLLLQFRQYKLGRPAWGGWTWRAITLTFTISYLYHLSQYLALTFSGGEHGDAPKAIRFAWAIARPLCGPLIAQLFFNADRDRLRRIWPWQVIIYTAYAITVPTAAMWGLAVLGISTLWAKRLGPVLVACSDATLGIALVAAIIVMVISRRPDDSKFRRRQRHWYVGILLLATIFLALELLGWTPWLNVAYHLLPLALLVVTVYFGERLMFFDVFAKQGALFFVALSVLAAYTTITSPYLSSQHQLFLKPWAAALTLLPLILATPWIYGKLSFWIDRAWLGRRFSLLEAATFFFKDLQAAVNEQDLLEAAESSLSQIFQSKACIDRIEETVAQPVVHGLNASLKVRGQLWGFVRVLPRADEVPFLSEDAGLLAILADAFGAMVENQRLRDQNLVREQREQELAIHAAESKLKALRAQINPHFLFNALNTIAALIPQRPKQAEQVLERLADVFHYAVHRSEREWVRLEEEIDFVRAYLAIEQARFGERLQVRILLDEAAENARIPALVVQTLVENAIKHGIATLRGRGLLTISAHLNAGKVLVTVTDNGPGFNAAQKGESLPPSSTGGYGLKNVDERLCAYFGSEAQLRFRRDADDANTVVSFQVPLAVVVREKA
jgi:signal transduction histidine kinase